MRITTRAARRVTGAAVAVVAGAAVALSSAAPAAAQSFNGSCESGEVCLYYYTGYNGYIADFYDNVSNYGNWHFWNSSAWLANNTESAINEAIWSCAELYDNPNYSSWIILMYSSSENGNFGDQSNKAESHKFISNFPYQCSV